MAIYRGEIKCFSCGEIINEIHKDQINDIPQQLFVGDTFIEYDEHKCKKKDVNCKEIQEGDVETI